MPFLEWMAPRARSMCMGESQTMPWAARQSDELVGVGSNVRVGRVGALTVVFVVGLPVRRFAREDLVGLRVELAALESMGLLKQADVARAGLFSEATFHRDCAAFRAGGEDAVRARTVRGSRGPRKLLPNVIAEIERLRAQELTLATIGQRLGMSTRLVDRALSAGKRTPEEAAPVLPGVEDVSASEPTAQEPRCDEEDARAEGEAAAAIAEVIEAARAKEDARAESEAVAAEVIEAERAEEDAAACARRITQQRVVELTLARIGQIEEQSALFPPIAKARFG